METKKFKSIPIRDFGNKIVITGIVLTNDNTEESFLMSLPQRGQMPVGNLSIIRPTIDEWKDFLFQTDNLEVEGKLNKNQQIVLRKSTRNIDARISWRVYRRDKYKCRYCGVNHVPLTVDHIITWETGGTSIEDNLLTSCGKCNRKRGNMDYEDWIKSEYYLKKATTYLTEEERQANERIVHTLDKLQKSIIIRNR